MCSGKMIVEDVDYLTDNCIKMKVCIRTIYFILLLTIHSQEGTCQCNGVYTVTEYAPNEPDFKLSEKSRWSVLPDQRMLIRIDTSNSIATSSHLHILSNDNFGIYTTKTAINDSSHSWQTFIRNRSTGESVSMGSKDEIYSIDLKNCFIRFCDYGKKGMHINIFDYKKSAVSVYYIRLAKIEPVGYNDTSIFLVPSDHFEFQKREYRYGTIISLNENGIQMIKPVQDIQEQFNKACVFYSNTFSAYKSFLYSDEKNCSRLDHYAILIKYRDALVDSFAIALPYYGRPSVLVKDDTLLFESYDNTYRIYTGATCSSIWELSKWVDSLPVLKNNMINYYKKGKHLLLTTQCSTGNRAGLQLQEDKWMTLNGIPLKPKSTYYTVFLLFDLKKNKFLGYPKLEFTNNNSL
jgi:hypothetical protein